MPKIPYTGADVVLPDPINEVGFFLYYVEPLSANCLKVWFSDHVVINNNYYNIDNYSIPGVTVNLVIKSTYTVCPFALLSVKPQIPGQSYTLTVSNLKNRSGVTIVPPNNIKSWTYNKTKLDSILSNMPSMFDKRAVSLMHRILGAIAYSDNNIGGAVHGVEE